MCWWEFVSSDRLNEWPRQFLGSPMKLEHVFKMPHRMPTYLSSPFAISNAIWVVLKKKKKISQSPTLLCWHFCKYAPRKKVSIPKWEKGRTLFSNTQGSKLVFDSLILWMFWPENNLVLNSKMVPIILEFWPENNLVCNCKTVPINNRNLILVSIFNRAQNRNHIDFDPWNRILNSFKLRWGYFGNLT